MSTSVPQDRFSRSTIRTFVSNQQNIAESTPLIEQQIKTDQIFTDASNQPSGPIDLLYRFNDERESPALGFQQIDNEQDEEEMYSLVYIDPSLKQAWEAAQ
ncbi:hypothetical protein KDA_44360 [Dictyobacter alpinus]|uniref:Uncharacterized protein n=1 Tax=Dictyobacter alpinus TaxID=2014873 RepID=A0A402BCD8_9CHLR|nr:hypothetical protein [Dictyobacter alpinus]GCE28952.1 hypothetical protein KDA_44360 [Dictyobacter alpinus]